jgi:hypothetical protein
VAGKDLSLHALYRQVTGLGGVIAVTADNKWSVSWLTKPAVRGSTWLMKFVLLTSDPAYIHVAKGKTGSNSMHQMLATPRKWR